jgi:hypothetical protein
MDESRRNFFQVRRGTPLVMGLVQHSFQLVESVMEGEGRQGTQYSVVGVRSDSFDLFNALESLNEHTHPDPCTRFSSHAIVCHQHGW